MSTAPERAGREQAKALDAELVWHDLECGSYTADLPLWQALAERNRGPVLEVGAGSGRVALELARAGHDVTALEREPRLLAALRARREGAGLLCVCADARSFVLTPPRRFALCIVPMHTIQLFGGAAGRAAFLRRARAALRPRGLLACAVLGDVESFDCASGDAGPPPESTLRGELLFMSIPTHVAVRRGRVVIARERRVVAARSREQAVLHREANVVELDRLTPRSLRREGIAAGLRPEPDAEIPPTRDHAGSKVVMLRA